MESLNQEQNVIAQRALNNRENLFISGSAGTGKTFLMNVLIQEFAKKYGHPKHVAITALTGIAAVSVNGTTLHSFVGMGLHADKKPSKFVLDRWCRTRVLFIDEISMLTAEFLDKFYKYILLYNVQVICLGDFLQLPPIGGKYCFESENWRKLNLYKNTILLKTIVRQKDTEFVKVLNEIRINEISQESLDYLYKLDISKAEGIKENTTKIYATNRNVYNENMRRLEQLETDEEILTAKDIVTCNGEKCIEIPDILDKMITKEVPEKIKLKVGAEVMMTRNRPPDYILVNGSRGTVVEIKNGIPKVEFRLVNSDETFTTDVGPVDYEVKYRRYKLTRMQVPLKLAWSMTVHRCQGMTLENVLFNTERSFETGQLYVGMSRATDPNGLIIDNVEDLIHLNKVCKKALDYYKNIQNF
jgi:ATP-dependent DNA helicase PIF1